MSYSLPELVDRRRKKAKLMLARRLLVALLAVAAAAAVGFASLATGEQRPSPAAELTRKPVASSPAKPSEAPRGKVEIAAVGDIAMGRTPVLPADDGASLFDGVRRSLAADVVLGNLETALTDGGTSKCEGSRPADKCFAFRAPPSYARALRRAGFTVLNLANNHSYDFGADGEADTVAALERAGLRHTGRRGEIAFQRVGAVRVAVLGFAPNANAQSLLDLEAARTLVERADARADVVVVTMHAGAEGAGESHVRPGRETYLGEDRGDVVAFAHAVVDAGADLVAGHGPHVLRGTEWYRRRLIAYSVGNFAGHHNFRLAGPTAVSGILRVTLRADGTWAGGKLVATRLVAPGTPVLDSGEAAHGVVRSLSRQDFGARAVRISRTGVLLRPPR